MRARRFMACLLFVVGAVSALAQTTTEPQTATGEEFTRNVFFGKKFADMGDYASAYDHLARAEALDPDHPGVLYNLAVVLTRAGRYAEAQTKVDRYQQIFPEGEQKAMIARLQLELQFQRELQKKRQSDQEYAEVFNRATFLYDRGELVEALNAFRQAETMRPQDPAPVFNQALVLEKEGDYESAIQRYRRYAELETDVQARGQVDSRMYALERELADMRSRIVCSFCGRKLQAGATWCERCWHGPYSGSAVWDSRPCIEGASATRSTYYAGNKLARNEDLPCLGRAGTMRETLRYSPALQSEIRDARRKEGWTYSGDMLQGWSDGQGQQIRYVQGADYLEKITAAAGEILTYVAHPSGDGVWLLDREDLVIDAQKYTSRYSFDEAGRVRRQDVEYQNSSACNHLIALTADYGYRGERLEKVEIHGGYEGFPAEGKPRADWHAMTAYSYDGKGRVASEELTVTSMSKTYDQRPHGELRDDITRLYASMRPRRPVEDVARVGDRCATSGSSFLTNAIDLRPLYLMSPNLAILLQDGIARAAMTFTYPDSYSP